MPDDAGVDALDSTEHRVVSARTFEELQVGEGFRALDGEHTYMLKRQAK